MKIEIQKFGILLISRPEGRDAALAIKAYSQPLSVDEVIELDFSDVDALTPSWLDEFIQNLKREFPLHRIKYLPCSNPSVIESIKVLEE